MAKFNVGDKVIGNAKANKYGITCEGWEGVVVSTDHQIMVQSEKGGTSFWVDANCFDLVKGKTKPNTKYQVGDKVKLVGDGRSTSGKSKYYGKIFTIKKVCERNPYPYELKECDFAWRDSEFAPANTNQKVVITTDGKTTIAKFYEDNKEIKTAKAKCCDDDAFDFATGAKLALERLFPREYKAGDKVKVTGNTCSHYAGIGNVITLKDSYVMDNETRWHFNENVGYIVEADFEPYDGAKEPAYKVGDKVEVIGNSCFHYYDNGRVLTIKHIDKDRIYVNEGSWFVSAADIKFYTGPSFKEGDKVKVIGNSVCHSYKIGSVITIKEQRSADTWYIKEGSTYVSKNDIKLCTKYCGKVVCVDNCGNPHLYTVGKVYQFVDGVLTADNGSEIYGDGSIKTFEDWAEFTNSKFVPLVED